MESKPRSYVAEGFGTFLVVLVGAGAICAGNLLRSVDPDHQPVAAYAIAEGFGLAVALTVTLYVSLGCLNPAITIMLWVFRRLETRQMAALIASQVMGAALAGLLLRLGFSEEALRDSHLGAPFLKGSLVPTEGATAGTLFSGTAVELLAGALVTLALFASILDPRAPRMGGVLVGMAQSAAVVFGFNMTGGIGNPARWFGPAIWYPTLLPEKQPSFVTDALIYCGGPVLGALAAAFLYHSLILPEEKKPGGRHR
jgi:aquaporin Z